MKTPTLAFSAALALALVIGCGGGGGGSSSGSSGTTSTAGTTSSAGTTAGTTSTAGTSSGNTTTSAGTNSGGTGTTFIPVQSGFATLTPTKTSTYTISGSYTPAGGTATTINGGTRFEQADPGNSSFPLLLLTTDSLQLANSSSPVGFTINAFATQGSSNQVVLQSVVISGTTKTVTTPDYVIPSTFSLNESFTKAYAYDGGGGATLSFAVGSATVDKTVPFGSYVTYPVTVTLDYGSGFDSSNPSGHYVRTGTFYYVPQLGTYIESDETITTPSGTETVTAVLTKIQQS